MPNNHKTSSGFRLLVLRFSYLSRELLSRELLSRVFLVAILTGCGGSQNATNELHHLASPQELAESFGFVYGDRGHPDLVPPGPGAGEWNSEFKTPHMMAMAAALRVGLKAPYFAKKYGKEAAETLQHFFENSGSDYLISVEKLLNDSSDVASNFQQLKDAAIQYAEHLPPGTHYFRSDVARVSSIPKSESLNWYLAVDGYHCFVRAQVSKSTVDSGQLTLLFHVWDKYDWDPDVIITIPTSFGDIKVNQSFLAKFHRQGLAQEYETLGVFRHEIRL